MGAGRLQAGVTVGAKGEPLNQGNEEGKKTTREDRSVKGG